MGKPHLLKSAYERISNSLIDFPNIVAPEASILDVDNFSMGKGLSLIHIFHEVLLMVFPF